MSIFKKIGDWIGNAASAGMGMITGEYNDKRQLAQQKKLSKLQYEQQRKLNIQGQALAMDMWRNTNYPEQRRQMELAGLNAGLLYGMGGGGGVTANAGSGGSAPSAGHAPSGGGEIGMALQIGLQTAMQKAMIKKTEAEAKQIEVQTDKTSGVDTQQAQSSIQVLQQQVKNEKIKEAILEYERQMAKIESEIKSKSQDATIQEAQAAADKLEDEARSTDVQADIDEATKTEQIQLIREATLEQQIRMAAMSAGITKTKIDSAHTMAGIKKIAAEISQMTVEQRQNWIKLDQNAKENWIKEQLMYLQEKGTEFQTSTPQQIRQWTEAFNGIITGTLKRGK